MLYLSGFFGFCVGFYAGLLILKGLLRGKSNAEITTDKSLWWKFGWIVWVMGFFGMWLGVQTYQYIVYSV
jgi:hypothetical protein